jgi:hypothetical protein
MTAPAMTSADPSPSHWDPESYAQHLVETCTLQLEHALGKGGASIYLLIDPMLGDPVLPEVPPASMTREALNALRAGPWERATHALQLPESLGMDAAFAPYLVELQDAQDPWLEASVQWAVQETVQSWMAEPDQQTPHRVGGWLQSAAQAEAVADLLSGWVHLRAAGAGKASYLRLGDRRAFSLAVHVLGSAHVARVMPPLQQWLWLDPQAALQSVVAAPSTTATNSPALTLNNAKLRPLAHFSSAQWAQMALGPQVHQAMAQSMGQRLRQASEPTPAQWQPVSADQWTNALDQARKNTGTSQHKKTQEGRH